MNIDEAIENIRKRVVCSVLGGNDENLILERVDKDSMMGFLRAESGALYQSPIGYIELHSGEKIKPITDNNLRKEIAFLLIQNGYVVDKGFKDTVDNVLDAITL